MSFPDAPMNVFTPARFYPAKVSFKSVVSLSARAVTCGFVGVWLALSVSVASADQKTVVSQVADATNWGALKWTPQELERFGGEPEVSATQRTLLTVRYSFYASNYDLVRRYPVWVAHVDRADSVLKLRGRKGGAWGRADDEFLPDENVMLHSLQKKIPFVTTATYTNANPPELPVGEKGVAKITRGHLASNAEMKSLGDPEEGQRSQKESFSLANVVPQMQRHNAPIWAKLEDNCIQWAESLGGVSVISGPVYMIDPAAPIPANRLLYTKGEDGVGIPIPTHLFKVVIGTIDHHPAAVGFLVPHRSDLTMKELPDYIVSVRKIEEMTGINFMPKYGKNDDIELKTDRRWLELLKKAGS